VVVQLYAAGVMDNPVATTKLILGPGESSTIQDPLRALFGMGTASGSLRLVSTTDVFAEIHANADDSTGPWPGGAGAAFEGVPAAFGIANGQASTLLGVVQTTNEGYRFSAVETSGQPATLDVSLLNDAGDVLASRVYDLPAHGEIEGTLADLSTTPATLISGRLKVEVTDGGGSILAYGLRTSALSANAAGFAMAVSDDVLVNPFTSVTSLNALTGGVTLAPGPNVTITTTPTGGGQPGGTITVDTPSYTAGNGLDLAAHQFSLSSAYRLPQGCSGGQLAAWNGAAWVCVNDTTYTAGTGLSLSGSQFDVAFGGSGSAGTASRSDHTHVGQTWSTSSGVVLTMFDSDPLSRAVQVASAGTDFNAAALYGAITSTTGSSVGVFGSTSSSDGSAAAVFGQAVSAGAAKAVWGLAGGANTYGVFGQAGATGSWAGYFQGNVYVNGTLSKAAGSFKIDDPIDPANKFLYHSFVESPDMMNIYNGNVVTDARGIAVVTMPAWFEALNRDFHYQLTVIGQFAQAIIAREITGGTFTIQTDKPNVKVSWQVTGVRQDPYANAHRIPVEEDKPADERGYYLHPELYGLGSDRSIDPGTRLSAGPRSVPKTPFAPTGR
jgi:hypothetical protein